MLYADLYDYNVWSDGEDVSLTAYEWMQQDGRTIMNSANYTSLNLNIKDPANRDTIAWLLENPYWEEEDWTDHDEWIDISKWKRSNIPPKVAEFLDSLGDYVQVVQ